MDMKPKFLLIIVLILVSRSLLAIELEIQRKKTGLSFIFQGQDSWDYKVDFKSNALKIFVPKLSKESVKKLQQFKDPFIRFVKIETDLSSRGDVIEFLLPLGYDYFDYVLQKPSRLIVDIFNKAPEKSAGLSDRKEVVKTPVSHSDSKDRKPTSTDLLKIEPDKDWEQDINLGGVKTQGAGLFDAADKSYNRFKIPKSELESNPVLKYYLGHYIDYPFLDERLTVLSRMKQNMPEYRIESDLTAGLRDKEKDYAKLLLVLFNKNRNLTFLKTAAWFEKNYPKSRYEEIVRAMWADTHYKLYLSNPEQNRKHLELAKSRYEEFIEKFPQSELIPRIHIFMGFASIEEKDYISAIRWFQRYLKRYPNSDILDITRLGLIRSLIGANQVVEAKREIDDLKNTTCQLNRACQIKADLLLADIAINREDWNEAEKIFDQMSRTYSMEEMKEERYFYNYASVLFRQKNFLNALDMYLEFITRYPEDPFAGYALTRIGEIIDITSTNVNRALGAYLEANFRYGTRPDSTALFARIRLLEKQLPSLKGRSRQVAIQEILDLSKKAKLPLAEDFGNFIVADQLQKSEEYDQAIGYLIDNYRNRPSHPLGQKYFEKIQEIQARKLVFMSSKMPLEALKYHELMQMDWLKEAKRIDVSYALAESYYNLGDYKSSETYYQKAIDLLSAFNLDTIENQVSLKKQNPPALPYLLLKLADSQKLQKKWQAVEATLRNLDSLGLDLSPAEKIHRASLLAQVLQEKGQAEYALRYIQDMKKLASNYPNQEAELLFKEFEALKKIGDNQGIMEIASNIVRVCQNRKLVSYCFKAERDVLVAKKANLRPEDYLRSLQDFLDRYSDYGHVDDLRYELGKIYLKNKNIKQAEEVWSQFRNSESGWAKLAKSDLEGAKFEATYREYFRKIPSLSRSPATSEVNVNE